MLPRFFMSGLYPCFFEFDFQVLARRHEFGADPEDIAVVRHEPALGEENTVAHRMHLRRASVAQGLGYVLPRKLLTRDLAYFSRRNPRHRKERRDEVDMRRQRSAILPCRAQEFDAARQAAR
jgi:hypothetical protein